MKTRYKPSVELGAFLRKWRGEHGDLTMEEAAERAEGAQALGTISHAYTFTKSS